MQETTVDRIYHALLERIVTGDLEAGAPLRQDHIAREYETSHVPVREALLRLEARGLAISIRHKGTRVTDLEPTEIREVIEMRIALETLALTHALPQLTETDLARATAARDACDAAETMAEWDRQDRLFHMSLLSPAPCHGCCLRSRICTFRPRAMSLPACPNAANRDRTRIMRISWQLWHGMTCQRRVRSCDVTCGGSVKPQLGATCRHYAALAP